MFKRRNDILNVLSLFDGMSCGRIALEKAGIKVDNYYSAEIDKYALKVADKNWPQDSDKRLGDVTKIKGEYLPKIDLLIGGSPCQGFSRAGNELNFTDPRSKLFFEFVRILKELKPRYFLLENVRMRKEFLKIISLNLGVEPIFINSSSFSAQIRPRYYWTNIPVKDFKDSSTVASDIMSNESDRVFSVNDNKRVKKITENDRGYRPHRGDSKSTGISELGRIIKPNGKTDAITTSHAPKFALNNSIDDLKYRKATPVECERLQTVPDNYTDCVSSSQRYKMLGNGWTVDVIAHIFKGLKPESAHPVRNLAK